MLPERFYSALRQFVMRRAKRLRAPVNQFFARYSLIGDPAVFEPSVFPGIVALEREWKTTRSEADAVLAGRDPVPPLGDISPDHRRLDHRRSWRCFFLWGYGIRVEDNCRRMPRTAALIDRIPGLLSAMISVHEPGTHLPLHRGPTKAHVTCHLPLRVPSDGAGCRIEVAGQNRRWTPGRAFVFDDTYPHEVWNETPETRVILLLHVRRPLKAPARWAQEALYALLRASPFVRDVRRNLAAAGRRSRHKAFGHSSPIG